MDLHEQILLIASDLALTPPPRYASEVNDHDRVIELCFLCVLFCLCNIKGKLQCIFITYSELSLKHVPK